VQDNFYSFCHEKNLINGMTDEQISQYIKVNNHRVGQGNAPLFIYEGLVYAHYRLIQAQHIFYKPSVARLGCDET